MNTALIGLQGFTYEQVGTRVSAFAVDRVNLAVIIATILLHPQLTRKRNRTLVQGPKSPLSDHSVIKAALVAISVRF